MPKRSSQFWVMTVSLCEHPLFDQQQFVLNGCKEVQTVFNYLLATRITCLRFEK